jgi:tetratricopeptide (TPR) repeat protein
MARNSRTQSGTRWIGRRYLSFELIFFTALIILSSHSQETGKRALLDSELRTGIALARKGDLRGAEVVFEDVVARHPGDPLALTALGQVQDQLGQSVDSIATFRKVLTLDPRSADAHMNLGISLADNGQLAAAFEESSSAIKLAPLSANAHFLRGRILSDIGRGDEARNEFRTVMELSPGYAEALFYWAQIEGDEGNTRSQGELLKRYVKLRPDRAVAYVELGHVLEDEQLESDAITAWKRAIVLNPNYADAIYSLARALRKTNPPESRQLRQKLVDLESDQRNKDRIDMLGNRANAEMADGNYKGAISNLNEAIALCGRCELLPPLEKDIGLAYCHAGQLNFGEQALKMAHSLRPKDASVMAALEIVRQQRSQAFGKVQ